MARTCTADGCSEKHYAKGYCRPHYTQVRRGRQPGPVAEYSDETVACAAADCEATFRQRSRGSKRLYCSRTCSDRVLKRNARAKGWVPAHKRSGRPPCSVDGCEAGRFSLGMCVMHYTRFKVSGDPGEATHRRAPKGEGQWRINGDGYVVRSVNGQTELQHREVMAERLGRPLWPDETAHHKNGDRSDNRIENLELWSKCQPAGQRVADKLAWAREIIARYGDLPPELIE